MQVLLADQDEEEAQENEEFGWLRKEVWLPQEQLQVCLLRPKEGERQQQQQQQHIGTGKWGLAILHHGRNVLLAEQAETEKDEERESMREDELMNLVEEPC